MSTGPKADNRGGARAGAGRPPITPALSAAQLAEFEAEAKKYAEIHGKTLKEVVLDIAYSSKSSDRDRLTAAKLYWDKQMVPVKEGGDADRLLAPALFLPEQRPHLQAVPNAESEEPKAA